MPAAKSHALRLGLAPLQPGPVLTRWVTALDYWILFSARLSRRPRVWVAVHRLLSALRLMRILRDRLELEHAGQRLQLCCRVRSGHLGWLLVGAKAGDVTAAGAEDDLQVIQVHPWSARWWRYRGWLTVPAFIRYTARVESVPPAPLSKSLRGNLARARRHGFRARQGHGSDWKRARAMAESWARVRFGADVWLPPRHAWRRMRRHGHLIVIGEGSRDVAMAVVVAAAGGREAWFASIGLMGGDTALLRAGALTAAYSAAVEEARRSGAAVFDAGRCSARADDRVAAYKARWGLRPTVDPLSPLFALRAHTPAGERLLADMPLWALGPGAGLQRIGPR